jgi:hypothetical protein
MTPRVVTTDIQKEVKLLATLKELNEATTEINTAIT